MSAQGPRQVSRSRPRQDESMIQNQIAIFEHPRDATDIPVPTGSISSASVEVIERRSVSNGRRRRRLSRRIRDRDGSVHPRNEAVCKVCLGVLPWEQIIECHGCQGKYHRQCEEHVVSGIFEVTICGSCADISRRSSGLF